MIFQAAYYIYYFTLLFAFFCSAYRFRQLDTASKILFLLICCAIINECAAYYFAKKYQNNLILYNVYCFVEFGILSLYFNNSIDVFLKKNIGVYIGILGIILGILSLVFIRHSNSINSYFLLFEGLSVIGMAFFAFFRLLLKHDSLHLYKYPHFWFNSIFVFFWSSTFLAWGLYYYINIKLQQSAWEINTALLIVSSIMYTSLAVVFLFYPKMHRINE